SCAVTITIMIDSPRQLNGFVSISPSKNGREWHALASRVRRRLAKRSLPGAARTKGRQGRWKVKATKRLGGSRGRLEGRTGAQRVRGQRLCWPSTRSARGRPTTLSGQ